MGEIINSYILPHPPIIIPEVGKGEEKPAINTITAVRRVAESIKDDRPTTIIITTPHGPVFQDYIYMSMHDNISGDIGKFGCSGVKLNFRINTDLAGKIVESAKNKGIFAGGLQESIARKYNVSRELDHGAIVPLYFINKDYKDFKLVHISIAGLPFIELYKFGVCIAEAVHESKDERVVFVASGDLSHKLSEDGPYGFNVKGPEYDKLLIDSLRKSDIGTLLDVKEDFCDNAGECGLRSFLMLFGALDGYDLKPEIISYEGPFGIGYGVAKIGTGKKNKDREFLRISEEKHLNAISEIRSNEDIYVRLARESLEAYVSNGEILKIPKGLPDEMVNIKAGAFVSIKKFGQLRGCIGTLVPTKKNVAEEIIMNAISSGTGDPRFDPIDKSELNDLVYSVDILGEAETINSIMELDVIKYGVIVRAGARSGLLLPNLEGVNNPEQQIEIALQKAGIKKDEKYSMERFEVIRHK